MTDPQPTLPDPRTADDDDILDEGQSAPAPAEGADDVDPETAGSPKG